MIIALFPCPPPIPVRLGEGEIFYKSPSYGILRVDEPERGSVNIWPVNENHLEVHHGE
jgi:hypothetical protein